MKKYLDNYIEASGVLESDREKVRQEFARLQSAMPNLQGMSSEQAAIAIKRAVYDAGFDYDSFFTIQDVLKTKRGSCLGMPLLIGTLLGEMGRTPRLGLQVNPKDVNKKCETLVFNDLNENTPYDKLNLATSTEERGYPFIPLEHGIIDLDGFKMETTSRNNHTPSPAESIRIISFNEALGCLYGTRSIGKSPDERYSLLQKGISAWPENSMLLKMLADSSVDHFDTENYLRYKNRFLENPRDDSLFNEVVFGFTGNPEDIEKSLKANPSNARAIAVKGSLLANRDPRESQFLYGLASQLYARSNQLSLPDFYVGNFHGLIQAFGEDTMRRVLEEIRPEATGILGYHINNYLLTRRELDLAEAKEVVDSEELTPLERARFEKLARGTKYADLRARRELNDRYKNSEVYRILIGEK